MIRTQVGKAAFLFAAAAIGAGAAIVGCSHRTAPSDDVGAVTVALTLSPGVVVNTVAYSITGNGITAVTGNIDVTNSAHATALVGGLPAANGYLLVMNATSTDTKTTCTGQTTFNVVAGQTASATVVLQCRGPKITTGTVAINGRLDNCPFITGYSASALEAPVGGSISIGVNATDYDTTDTIVYTWTAAPAGIGTITAPGSASTSFTCTALGMTSLSIAVSDGVCGDILSNVIPINCLPSGSGGSTGAGGGAGGSTGGAAGSSMGGNGMGGGVGGGVGGGMGGGTGGAPPPPVCANEPVSAGACCDCVNNNCSLAPNPDGTDGCEGLSDPNDRALCAAAVTCFDAPTHPGSTVSPGTCTTSGDAAGCFCGTSGAACFSQAGAANGACVAQVLAAGKTNDPATIRGLFISSASPLGRAVNLTACQGVFCPTECGIK